MINETRKAENYYHCHNCKTDLVCPICGEKQKQGSEFSLWLRELDGPLSGHHVSNHNLDFIWRNRDENWFILIEEKIKFEPDSKRGHQRKDQKETHGVVHQLLNKASGSMVTMPDNTIKQMEYRGYFLIQFQAFEPDDSVYIYINGEKSNKEGLLYLLRHGCLYDDF